MRYEFIIFVLFSAIITAMIGYFYDTQFLWLFIIFIPLYGIGIYDMFQKHESIIRNFPIIGRGRRIMEEIRPKVQQYFIESNTNGTPINRSNRELVYRRAVRGNDTIPFGTQYNVYSEGYEWMHHSIAAKNLEQIDENPRVLIGGSACTQPYSASILNISAMSFGSLSYRAVEALNGGASLGHFAHNTGEGGIAKYHLEQGGDLIFQIGTGYFGVRSKDGNFSPELFKEKSWLPQVKMIEIKLSQGAKPGHGGILPAKKNTPEISEIRHVEPGVDVISPSHHTAFSTPVELMQFVCELRELSGGKPIGFKMCVGAKMEFLSLCKAMIETGITPDFITIDGGEGGTGAAPNEFSDSVGTPYREGLAFAYNALVACALKKEIKILASGKILSGFDMFRAFALGADACYSARGMMLALGCIQALECNTNTCPTGVATQNKELVAGLSIKDKRIKVLNFHNETIHSFRELIAAAGLDTQDDINRYMIYRRINMRTSCSYAKIYPYYAHGCFLNEDTIPKNMRVEWELASAKTFQPKLSQSVH